MEPTEECGDLLEKIGEELATTPLMLTFQPVLERRYRMSTALARKAHYTRVSVFGLMIYNLFLYTDWLMMPDVIGLAMLLQLGLVTPVSVISIVIMQRRPSLYQPVLLGTLVLVMASNVTVFSQSQTQSALMLPFALPSTVLTGNVMMPLRFSLALPFTLICGLMITPAILVHPGYAEGLEAFTLLTVLSTCAFTLFAAYQMESSDRRAFLLSLREALRADNLAHDNQHLRALAGTDGLTGVGNRRLFDATLEGLWQEALATQEPLGLLMLDADHFKALNDRYGHQAGDRCLVLIGTILREHTREGRDCPARYGGEEFAVLLPDASLDRTQEVAERLRAAIEAAPLALDGPPRAGALCVSIGCASMVPRPGVSPVRLIKAADTELYEAKCAGRNRIHPPLPLQDNLPLAAGGAAPRFSRATQAAE